MRASFVDLNWTIDFLLYLIYHLRPLEQFVAFALYHDSLLLAMKLIWIPFHFLRDDCFRQPIHPHSRHIDELAACKLSVELLKDIHKHKINNIRGSKRTHETVM